jgi:hypothetical protein
MIFIILYTLEIAQEDCITIWEPLAFLYLAVISEDHFLYRDVNMNFCSDKFYIFSSSIYSMNKPEYHQKKAFNYSYSS